MKKQRERKFKDGKLILRYAITIGPYIIYTLKMFFTYLDLKCQKWAFDQLQKRDMFNNQQVKL